MKFRFDIPVDVLEKSNDGAIERHIGGICSTDDLDQDDERLLQDGLDFGPFLKSGWFNDNHAKETGAAVGVPTMATLQDLPGGRKGWYVEGTLLDTPRANEIFSLAKALQGTTRRLGFSVEGMITDRDPTNPNNVRKAVVREVAVTRCPVNNNTSLHILAKSLSAGHGAPDGPATGENAGSVLAPEALERKKTKAEEEEEDDEKKKAVVVMTKAQAIEWLRQNRNVSPRVARLAVAWTAAKENQNV